MARLRAVDLINAITQLDKARAYPYFSGRNEVRIVEIIPPEGPIRFSRIGEADQPESISIQKIATAASVFSGKPDYPIHFERLYSGGGNDRSALETLLAYTPNFFICYPQKTNPYTGILEETSRNKRQKHLMWCPDDRHDLGVLAEKEYEQVISAFEFGTSFGDIQVTADMLDEEFESIAAKKTHSQIQVALVMIGNALRFRTYIARNDQSILVGDVQLGSLEGTIQTLDDVPLLYKPETKRAAALIDCIWFTQDLDFIPAVVEVEHSTGVTSGLTRMLKFKETVPALNLTFTIVAPDELRSKVVSEANNRAFRSLGARFMPYTTVRFLYGLVQKYSLAGVVERGFIEPFMERIVE